MLQNNGRIPVSVIVVTRNEAPRLERCLNALSAFQEIVVVDSHSDDGTAAIAERLGARVEQFSWDGCYPKKRQWALDHLDLPSDRIFFVDADEIVSPELCHEISGLDWACAGYFVRGRYPFEGRMLRYGLHNNKLCLFDRRKIEFPVVDDMAISGMGEIEGHYQPVLKREFRRERIGQIRHVLVHEACEDMSRWSERHERYALWEAGMNKRGAWPKDPLAHRELLKRFFRKMPFRPEMAFAQSYFFKLGFLDGATGFRFAKIRAQYYRRIRDFSDQ